MVKDKGNERLYKTWKRAEDVLDYRSERALEIVKVIRGLRFHFALISDKEYQLEGYEIIRLINILMTVKRMGKSLNSFEKLLKEREKTYKLLDWNKPGAGIIKTRI